MSNFLCSIWQGSCENTWNKDDISWLDHYYSKTKYFRFVIFLAPSLLADLQSHDLCAVFGEFSGRDCNEMSPGPDGTKYGRGIIAREQQHAAPATARLAALPHRPGSSTAMFDFFPGRFLGEGLFGGFGEAGGFGHLSSQHGRYGYGGYGYLG